MEVHLVTWIITIVVLLGFIVFDFYSHVKSPHEPTMKEAGGWMAFYMSLAGLFTIFLWFNWTHEHALEFFNGYITELSLSIDNLFIFALIIGSFKTPRAYQQKVLLIGIALALAMRLIFILLGAAAINAWSWVFYIFGAFLLYTAIKLVVDEVKGDDDTDIDDMFVVKTARKVIPVSSKFHGDHLFTVENGKKMVTPLMLALVSIGFIDLMFAFDSIPAIFGLTQEPYIVFAANAFALMGLRQMFFLLDGLLERLVYLPYGLATILAFIGVKLVLHALHENKLPFINGGEGVEVPEIGNITSLFVIVGVLAVTAIASIIKTKRDEAQGAVAPDWNPASHTPKDEDAEQQSASEAPTSSEIHPRR
ncbi:TerC family integral membrane protein [Corynebacterium pyruviciproducens ATCC BAA-1742]|uniref:TerC family integral membrane protein n=1 Tax=Corynebacterium pyruviciproducens ATCC BAA-1742 TaxID=1125779 RepID=S2ZIG8_9CORY|nr:TerC family protein [Corynebacterium pyruviciproducens]EPD69862.1 TerC family integral membrane protein [Corynebacterium pyruviciproducens ATCC BAA-1742]